MKPLFLRKNAYGLDIGGEVNDKGGNIRDTADSPEFNYTKNDPRNSAQDGVAQQEFPGLGPSKSILPQRGKN